MRTLFSIFAGALVCLPALAVKGVNDLPRYDYEIELRTIRQALPKVEMKHLAAEINLDMPVRAPMLLDDQVERRIEQKVLAAIEAKFPSARYDEIAEAASEKYRMYKIGDFVSIEGIQRGEWRRIEGHLDAITNERLKLGDIYYARQDLTDLTRPKFYREDHEEAVRKYITIQTRNFDLTKKEFREEQRRLFANQEWPKFGYVYSRRMRRWVPAEAVLRSRYQKKVKSVAAELRDAIKEEIYAKNGYILDKLNQQWVLEGDAALASQSTMLAKVRQFLLQDSKESQPGNGSGKQDNSNPGGEWEDEWGDEDQGNIGQDGSAVQAAMVPALEQGLRPKQPNDASDFHNV